MTEQNKISLLILVVDDTQANLDMLKAVLTYSGHRVITAHSGEEGLDFYRTEPVDVVLMDVMMPGMGGIEATRRMRALDVERWVPIIFVSALGHRDDVVAGLEAGGDDYLSKPVDVVLLLAKINALQRIAVLESRLQASNQQLNAYHDQSEHQLALAREMMEQMARNSSRMLSSVETWMQSAANLGGDLILTQQFGEERDYIMLADAMGHGLSATLPLVPLVQVFSDMTRTGRAVSAIIREMNLRLTGLLPVGNFVAVTLVSLDRTSKELQVWNGGNPAALLCDENGRLVRKFSSRHIAIGICGDTDFDAEVESFVCEGSCSLTLYSDGLLDAVSEAGEVFGEERALAIAQQPDSHHAIKQAVLAHMGGHSPCDDISLATATLA